MKTLKLSCGTCRHPQDVKISAIALIESSEHFADLVSVTLKPRHWIQDTWGDGQWHGTAVADAADVAALIFKTHSGSR